MLYTVKFKRVGDLLWKKIKKVKCDFIAQDIPTNPRVLILSDESRIELPTEGMLFYFSKERHAAIIRQKMEENQSK